MDNRGNTMELNQLPTAVHLLHGVTRFARVVRYRWMLVATTMAGVLLLGILYFATAKRTYQARAQLLVQQTGPVVTNGVTLEGTSQQGMLPTYERLFVSTIVLEGALERIQKLPRPMRTDFISTPRSAWVTRLRERLSVRSFRLTNVIEVAYASSSPEAAEAVVTAVVDSYLEFMKQNHQTVGEELVTILHKEHKDVEEQLRVKEQLLVEAKRKFGDLGLRDESQTLHPLVQRVVKTNDLLIESQQTRLKLQASLASLEKAIEQGVDLKQHLFAIEPVLGREVVLSALGLSEQDGVTVARLEQQLIDQQAELESLRPHYGSRHPKVNQLEEAVQQTRVYLANYQEAVDQRASRLHQAQFGEMLRNLVTQELQKAKAQEKELQNEYRQAQAAAIQLQGRFEQIAMLQREVDRLVTLNHTLLNRIDGIDINQNQADVRVEVVSRPEASRRPVSPNLTFVALLSLTGGLTLAVAVVYAVDVLDDRFRSVEEMKNQLQCQVLAMVRQMARQVDSGMEALQVHMAPDSVEAEAFRTLRTTLAFRGEELECVAVSSSEPGDGKTTILANLGLSFAQSGKRTLLIDADLRRPGLTRLLDLKGQPGLSDILSSSGDLVRLAESVRYRVGNETLDVIPSGPRPLDPTGLLASGRFAELLSWASGHYDQILIDSPPLLVASDAAIVGRMAGGLVLVVQPQKNHRRLVVRAVEEARAVGLHLIGIVVNKLTDDGGQSYYGDGYGYWYGYGHEEGDANDASGSGEPTREEEDDQLVVTHGSSSGSRSVDESMTPTMLWPRRVRAAS